MSSTVNVELIKLYVIMIIIDIFFISFIYLIDTKNEELTKLGKIKTIALKIFFIILISLMNIKYILDLPNIITKNYKEIECVVDIDTDKLDKETLRCKVDSKTYVFSYFDGKKYEKGQRIKVKYLEHLKFSDITLLNEDNQKEQSQQ